MSRRPKRAEVFSMESGVLSPEPRLPPCRETQLIPAWRACSFRWSWNLDRNGWPASPPQPVQVEIQVLRQIAQARDDIGRQINPFRERFLASFAFHFAGQIDS